MFRTTKGPGALGVSVLALAMGLVFTQAALAKTTKVQAGVDDPPVTSCGTLTASNTIYLVTQDISTSSTSDCIVLTGSDDTLDLQGHNITFTGAAGTSHGAGVKITGNTDVVDGFNGTVTGFAEGVLDNGDTTVGDDINFVSNAVGLQMTGNTGIWTNFFSANNTAQGVYLKNCGDECTVSDFQSLNNGGDGLLITGSDGARAGLFVISGNSGNGVHVGCSSSCGGEGGSRVRIGDAPTGFDFVGEAAIRSNTGDGVFLDKSESSGADQVFVTKTSDNGGFDVHDATSNCGNNHWVHNDFGTANAGGTNNPVCIPNVPF